MVLMTEIMPSRNETPGNNGGMTNDSSLWPKLGESQAPDDGSPPNLTTENDEWEFVSEDSSSSNGNNDDGRIESLTMNPKILHHCASTPDLNQYESYHPKVEDEEESFDHCSMGVDAQSVVSESSHVLVSHTEKPLTRRVPSFKDAILLNVQETKREEADAAKRREHAQRMLRKEALAKRSKPRLVVKPVAKMTQRNSKSTGDLNCLLHSYATIHEDEDDCHGGGGGGGGFAAVQEDEEVMGDTDAQDFYAQKSKGGSSRANSKKIRPDEAKRLDIILYKKEEQRRKQRERQNGCAGVRGKKKDTPKK